VLLVPDLTGNRGGVRRTSSLYPHSARHFGALGATWYPGIGVPDSLLVAPTSVEQVAMNQSLYGATPDGSRSVCRVGVMPGSLPPARPSSILSIDLLK
jgi:hypothetical protein